MNPIIKKAGMSILSGIMCTLGSWITKEILVSVKNNVTNNPKQNKESSST